jgi:hypothetical protein
MPYILQEKRDALDSLIDDLHHVLVGLEADDESNNMEGNMNYLITRLLRKVYDTSYTDINAAVGMLNCVILEHYRAVAGPYEAQKCFENGDVDAENVSIYTEEMVIKDTNNDPE